MKRIANYILMAVAVCAMATGCQKEDPDGIPEGSLALLAESMSDGSKTTVNDKYLNWVSGDLVLIKGEVCTVSVEGNTATVTSARGFGDGPFYGVYPSSIYTSNDGATYTVTLPRTYTYKEVDGHQNLEAPMVGYAARGEKRVKFKHLTAAVDVKITNYYGFQIEVDSIQVVSTDFHVRGDITVTINGSDPTVSPISLASGTTIVSLKSDGVAKMRVDAGETGVFQIPVRPVGTDSKKNHFRIRIWTHKVDQPDDVKTLFDKTQTAGGKLGRKQLAYAPVTFGGWFNTATQGTKATYVIISQGNLQYRASDNTWQFAKEQYSFIGNASGNSTTGTARSTQSDWIDFFRWGTSGYNCGNTHYKPYVPGGYANKEYGPSGKTASLEGASDWGVYNAISNGGNQAGRWRTMGDGGTYSEWEYLMIRRTGPESAGRYSKARVNGVKGFIIFPENFVRPDSVSISNINKQVTAWEETIDYSLTDWYKFEIAGAVFLPCTGYWGSDGYDEGSTKYWGAKASSASGANCLSLSATVVSHTNTNRSNGCCVRLVRTVTP